MKTILTILLTVLVSACGETSSKSNKGADDPTGENDANSEVEPGNKALPEQLGKWRRISTGFTENLYDSALPIVGKKIFVVGAKGTFLQSDDDGLTWSRRDVGTSRDLNVIKQVNSIIYVGGDRIFLFSADSGMTFNEVPGIDFNIRDIDYTTSGDGAFLAVGDQGRIGRASHRSIRDIDELRAQDLSWELSTIEGAPDLRGVSASFNRAKIVGLGGFVAVSSDVGRSFKRDDGARTKLDFYTIDDDYMAGNGVFAKRFVPSGWPADSYSWKVVESTDLPTIRSIWCTADCLSIGEIKNGSTIMKISEKGTILTKEAENIYGRFYSIANRSSGGMIAVGSKGNILIRDRID